MIASLVTVVIASAVGPFLDQYPDGLSLLYAVGTAVGLLGIVFFRRVSVIGENDHLLQEREALNQRRQSVGFLTILRNDQKFTRYQISMFAAGFGNMLIEAPLIFLITRELSASYATSIGLTMVIPFAISLLSLPLWARYLDRSRRTVSCPAKCSVGIGPGTHVSRSATWVHCLRSQSAELLWG